MPQCIGIEESYLLCLGPTGNKEFHRQYEYFFIVEDRNFVGVNCIETLMIIINLTLCMVIFSVNNY